MSIREREEERMEVTSSSTLKSGTAEVDSAV